MSNMAKRKVLLMGKSGSGKTSMRSIIFANYIARDTSRLGPTIEVEHAHVRFLGNLVLHLWDCGGQENFMEHFLSSQKDQIFRNVQVLIYVFDVESRECDRDYKYYQSCLEALVHNSPQARVFVLIHKMDLIPEEHRDKTYADKVEDIMRYSRMITGQTPPITCYKSSIWDETLYKAWSAIVYQLVPNVSLMEQKLRRFAEISDADEVLLFEKATFLVIAHAEMVPHRDKHRFEKVSNIVKQFKLSCSKMGSQFEYMQVKNSNFTAFIDSFTANTFIMLVISDGNVATQATLMNIKNAREHFERLEQKPTQATTKTPAQFYFDDKVYNGAASLTATIGSASNANMEIALPLAAASSASIFLYKKVIPARVECWFCSTKQWVRRSNANSFFCRQCTQYNGFTADGDYNRRVPGQHNWTLKTPTYCVRQRSARPDVVPTRATNGLCDKCNNAQELILQRVASFEASNEETWADELEDYKHRLEKAYPLCEKCVFALRKKLDEDKMKYGYLVNAKRFLVEGTVRLVNPLMPTKRKRFFVAGGRTVFFQVLELFFPLLLLSTFFHRIRQTSPLFDSPSFSPIADAFVDAVEINSVTIALLAFVAHFLGVWYSKARVTFCDLLFPVIALALAVVNNYNFDWSNEDRLMSQFALSGALFVVATAVLFIPQKLKHKKRPNTISSAFSVASTPMSQLSRSTISETSPLATTKFSPEPTISSSRTQETPSIISQRTTSDSTRRPHAMAASPFTRFRGRSRESTPAFAGGGVSDSSMEWEDSVFEMNSRMTGRRVEPQQTIMTRSAAFREARKGREETPVTSRLASVFGGLDLDSSSDDDYRSTMTVKSKRSHISSPLNGHQNRVFPQPPPSVLSTTFTELSKRRAGVSKTPSPFSRAQSVYSVSQTLGAGSSASSMMTVATTQALEQNYRWIKALVGVVVLLLLVNVVQLYINFKP